MEDLNLALFGWLALSSAMALLWLRQRKTENAGPVDILWTFGIGALAVFYALLADGWSGRRWLVGILAAGWSLRLGIHLARRILGEKEEDGRYAKLREEKGQNFDKWAFFFFQVQALQASLLALTFLFLASNPEQPHWRIFDTLGVLLWAISLSGESQADRQLARWKANPENRGRTCRGGWWQYSRHPNYFFEWLHWLVYPVLGIGLTYGWLLWLAPATMLALLLWVTGIPLAEERALLSRGEDYRRYQRATNAFFPGPSRSTES